MAAIVGLWSQTGNQQDSSCLHQMAQQLKLSDQDGITFFQDSHFSFALVHQPDMPLTQNVWQNETSYAALIGDIFNARELTAQAAKAIGHSVSLPEALMHGYRSNPETLIQSLQGVFALVLYNKTARELIVINDRLAQIRLYHTELQDKIIFSSKAKAILAHPKARAEVNEASVFDMFLFRSLMEFETLFKNIHLLPPASHWRLKPDSRFQSRYWSLEQALKKPAPCRNKRDYPEQCRLLFNQAVQRTLSDDLHFNLGLTAGMDSRCILSAMHPEDPRVSCFTIGNDDNPDVIIARSLAESYKLPHTTQKIQHTDAGQFIQNLKQCVYLSEGLANIEGGIYLSRSMKQREEAMHARQITGTLGTQIMRAPLFFANKSYLLSSLEDTIFGKIPVPHPVLTGLFDGFFSKIINLYIGMPNPVKFINPRYLKAVKDRFHTVNQQNYREADEFNFYSLSGKLHYIALKHLVQNNFPSRNPLSELYYRTPFIDNDFVDLIIHVPLDMKSEIKMPLHKYIIQKNSEALTSIPYYNKAGIAGFTKGSLEQWENKISKNIPKTIISELGHRIRTDLKDFTASLLLKDTLYCAEYFNKKLITDMVENHFNGRVNATYMISNLIVLELWHDLFWGEGGC